MKKVTKLFDCIYAFFMTTCKLAFIAMVVICALVVINRYVIKAQMVWGEPIVLMCMVYMSLVSAALAIRKDTHIRMQIVDYFCPPKAMSVIRAFGQILIFFFGLFMIIYGWQFSMLAGKNIMTGVGIKSMWLYLTCPMAGIAMCLMEIERFINCIDRIRRGITLDQDTMATEAKAMVEDTIALQKKEGV